MEMSDGDNIFPRFLFYGKLYRAFCTVKNWRL